MSIGDYEVGFRKPPRAHQWVKGQSGNWKGRPKKKTTLDPIAKIIEQGLMRKIAIPGLRWRITILELILKQIIRHMRGKRRKKALQVWRKFEAFAKSKPAIRFVTRKSWGEAAKEKEAAANAYGEFLKRGVWDDQ